VFYACVVERGFVPFGREQLVGPPLLWPEVRSALHESASRGALTRVEADAAFERLGRAPIVARTPGALGREAWRIADEFGWMKTYDAEYVALAVILRCRLVTTDEGLRRATSRLGFVVGPTEI